MVLDLSRNELFVNISFLRNQFEGNRVMNGKPVCCVGALSVTCVASWHGSGLCRKRWSARAKRSVFPHRDGGRHAGTKSVFTVSV